MKPGLKFKKLIKEDAKFKNLSSFKLSELSRVELLSIAKHLFHKRGYKRQLSSYPNINSYRLCFILYSLM